MKRKRKRTSVIWKLSKNEFQRVVKNSRTLADILRYFNLHVGAGNYPTLKRRIEEENIDVSHINLGPNSRKGNVFPLERKPIESYLTVGVKMKQHIKRRLIEEGFLEEKCSECGLGQEWNGKPITLTIDHINGNSTDGRLENLRILCPNCHSQTDTFSGKHKHPKTRCLDCCKVIGKHSKRCMRCRGVHNRERPGPNKIKWPSEQELHRRVWEIPTSKLAKELGVSDKAIEKRLKKFGLTKPGRGYWSKFVPHDGYDPSSQT